MRIRSVYQEPCGLGHAWTLVELADQAAWADRLADLLVRALDRLRAAHPAALRSEAMPQGFSL